MNSSVEAARPPGPSFAMLACAHGAEKCVQSEIEPSGWRLAFSRPGLVTAKNDATAAPLPGGVFIRTAAHSIAQCRGENVGPMIDHLVAELERLKVPAMDHLHVFPRDRAPIGRFDFEPGSDPLTDAIAEQLATRLTPDRVRGTKVNAVAGHLQSVLDVMLVDPNHWCVGWHRATTPHACWPGGVQPVDPEFPPISRAYYKAAESIAWSGFDVAEDDLAIEIGSAPGGACGRLLEMGLRVIGIDPATMDPRIERQNRFTHIRARGGDLPRTQYANAKWLLVDSNVRPDQTLTTVENIVQHSATSFQGLLLTLKIGGYEHADRISKWSRRIESWKPKSYAVKQLARNKVEVCYAIRL